MKQVAILALCIAFLFGGCQTGPKTYSSFEDWRTKIAGTYKGYIFSDGSYCPGNWSIFKDTSGTLRGEYEFYENGVNVSGTLYNFRNIAPLKIQCRWRDKYGTGDLEMVFDEAFSTFDGTWNAEGGSNKSPWIGQKYDLTTVLNRWRIPCVRSKADGPER